MNLSLCRSCCRIWDLIKIYFCSRFIKLSGLYDWNNPGNQGKFTIKPYFVRGFQPPPPPPLPYLRHPLLDSACLPFLKSLFPSHLFCSTSFQGILDSSLPADPHATPNLPWFKQISKGWFYQFNCCFLHMHNNFAKDKVISKRKNDKTWKIK